MHRSVMAVVIAVSLVGCYHAVVETGRPTGTEVISRKWAHGFLFGLVPPSTTETASKCPTEVAKVETQLSFLNQVANAITLGIYTPMQIDVTCSTSKTASAEVTAPDAEVALALAVQQAMDTREAVYVRMPQSEAANITSDVKNTGNVSVPVDAK